MLKLSALALIEAGIVIWGVCENRNVRLGVQEERSGDSQDVDREMCFENTGSDDVVDPHMPQFGFPEIHVDWLPKNVVSAIEDSWECNCAQWGEFRRLRTAATLAAVSYGRVTVAFDDNERMVALESISNDALPFRGPNFIAREVEIMLALMQENWSPFLRHSKTRHRFTSSWSSLALEESSPCSAETMIGWRRL